MKRTAAGMVATAVAGLAALLAGGVAPAAAQSPGSAPAARGLAASRMRFAPGGAGAQAASALPVIVIGIAGLRWTDISADSTPAIWRLAEGGAVGALATTAVNPVTCPADAWLTLNSGARAAAKPAPAGRCGPLPAVQRLVLRPPQVPPPVTAIPGPAGIPAMRGLIGYNRQFSYGPDWGVLAQAAGPGHCATAIGPGAALALADPAGEVPRYLQALPGASRFASGLLFLRQCPLTVVDLGALPPAAAPVGAPGASAPRRTVALSADDRAVGRIVAAAPAGAIIVLASAGDAPEPHLGVIVVAGPGYRAGLVTSSSTRQPGIVAITDLTPSIFSWRAAPGPPLAMPFIGAAVKLAGRGSLPAAIKTMTGQDTASQVYRSTVGWFFLFYGAAEAALLALIALAPGRRRVSRPRRRIAAYSAAAAFTGAVPVGTFLAGLARWPQSPHPALLLYGLGFAWAAVIAAVAHAGPWRRDPFGPPGFVAAVTLAVIAIDVVTGSRLQLGAPFGLSLLVAGRFYGVGNNALGIYAASGLLTAAWAATATLRCGARSRGAGSGGAGSGGAGSGGAGSRRRAVAAAGGVALVTVTASGWPGFGAKAGGTIAMVPAFLLLLAVVGGVRITARRGLIIGVSGLALVTAFAVADYLVPAIGASHLGAFAGTALHGHAGGTLQRKFSSNLRSLTRTWYSPAVPVAVVITGLMLAWPARFRLRTFIVACSREPLVRTTLFAVWLAVTLGWLVDDSGVTATAAALPLALPLAIAIVVRVAHQPQEQLADRLIYEVPDIKTVTGRMG